MERGGCSGVGEWLRRFGVFVIVRVESGVPGLRGESLVGEIDLARSDQEVSPWTQPRTAY